MAEKDLNVGDYRNKALDEIEQVQKLLKQDALALAASRAYYAVFYAIKALLENIDVKTGSHKQTHIEFRKNFIKTKKLDAKFSKMLTKLFEVRGSADYDIRWATNKVFVERVVKEAKEFVSAILDVI